VNEVAVNTAANACLLVITKGCALSFKFTVIYTYPFDILFKWMHNRLGAVTIFPVLCVSPLCPHLTQQMILLIISDKAYSSYCWHWWSAT